MRILTICVLAWAAFFACHAGAQTIQDQVVSQLKAQGYDSIRVSRTLLGRTRIIADSDESRREIVVNPRTGEILRDFWKLKEEAKNDNEREHRILSSGKNKKKGGGSGNSGKGSGGRSGNSGPGGGHGDDDDDDRDNSGPGGGDDDDDNDNSGPGSGGNDDDDDDDDD